MVGRIIRTFKLLRQTKIIQLFRNNYIRVIGDGKICVSKSASLKNVRILVQSGGHLNIRENANIENAFICVEKGSCDVGNDTIIKPSEHHKTSIIINDGLLRILDHTKISANRIWIRFGGRCEIGRFTNINYGSEIRCDNSVMIGDYNQISYNVNIWDTNTHNILPKEDRRIIAEKYFPYYGYELSCPQTKPVKIGDDCWIGQNASILKGTIIENEVIVGYQCLLVDKVIQQRSTVVSKSILDIYRRD